MLALGLIALVVVAVLRGVEVRLVLLTAALAIASVAGDVRPVVREFLQTISNEKFVVPICSAMGFAYVLRHTECERHLVLLLIKPLRFVRPLLVPGVICVGFLVNIPVISQTSTVVCIGPVVLPLMRAAGFSMPTIGAALLLGSSVGGELLNPGAPELLTVFDKTGVSTIEQASNYLPPVVLMQLVFSTLVFWPLAIRHERCVANENSALRNSDVRPSEPFIGSDSPVRLNILKACVPLVPIALLFASALPAPYNLFEIPDAWVVLPRDGARDSAYNSRLIGFAMLVGVLVATIVSPSKIRDSARHFFEGAGYGFANIVSLIVTANCFGVAIREAGLATDLGHLIVTSPQLLEPLAAGIPLLFAAVCGSGMASTQSLYGVFHDPAVHLGLDPTSVGTLVAVGSAAGRTMSPVAAVTLMCAALTATSPLTLVKRVAPPLIAALAAVVTLRLAGVI